MPSTNIGQIDLGLGLDSSKFNQQVRGIEKATKKQFSGLTSFLSNFLANMATSLLNNMLSQMGNFVSSAIDLSSDLEEVENVVDTVFSNMETQVDSFTQSAMESFGLSELVAKQYMGTIGAMAKAFDYSESQAYDLARSITGLTADVASFYNLSTDEAFDKLKSIFTGETESLKSLGVVMTQSALDAFAMANGFGKTTSEMSESEKVALRYKFVLDKLQNAQGDFAKTSDSWANQTRVLKLRWDELKSTLGTGFITILTPLVQWLNALISKMTTVAAVFTSMVKRLMGVSEEASSTATGTETAADASEVLAENTEKTAEQATIANKALLGFDKIHKVGSNSSSDSSAVGDIGSFDWGSMELGPSIFDDADEKVEALMKKFDKFKEKLEGFFDPFVKSAKKIFDPVTRTAKKIFSVVTRSVENALGPLKTGMESVVGGFVSVAEGMFTVVTGVISRAYGAVETWITDNEAYIEMTLTNLFTFVGEMFSLVGTILDDIGSSIKTWWEKDFSHVFDGLVKVLTDVWSILLKLWNEGIMPFLNNVKEAVSDLWEGTLKGVLNDALNLLTSIGEFIVALWDKFLKPFIDSLIIVFGPTVKEIATYVLNFFKVMAEGIGSAISGLITILTGLLDFLTGVFTGDWEKAWNGIVTALKGVLNTIISLFEMAFNIIITVINAVIGVVCQSIVGAVNGIIQGAKSVAGIFTDTSNWKTLSVDSPKIPPLDIPRLAEGGFVKANQPQLAIIGDNRREGEIVAPESKISEAVSEGIRQAMAYLMTLLNTNQGDNTPIQIVIQIGDEILVDKVITGINKENRRTGKILIKA